MAEDSASGRRLLNFALQPGGEWGLSVSRVSQRAA